MRSVAVFLAASALSALALKNEQTYYEEKFYNWMQKYGMQFKDGTEFAHRLKIFAAADDLIDQHNAGNYTYTMGHNQFSHMTWEEFVEYNHLDNSLPEKLRNIEIVGYHDAKEGVQVPSSWDWSTQGAVTPIKDQGSCGSCWSFSTTGALEGAYYIKYGNLQSFSEQNIVSCDTTDSGCNGGWPSNAINWVKSNGGVCSEASYPYTSGTGTTGTCQNTCSKVSNSAPTGYVSVASSDSALQSAVYQQPVSVCVNANNGFMYYQSGVYSSQPCLSALVNHAVLNVGYGTYTDGTPYWKIKNSWGTSWGMSGYILLARNQDQCGVNDYAVYPTY